MFVLKNRSLLLINGYDTIQFLQNLITQDILKIKNEEILYTLFLNHKGRYESDFFIIKKNNQIILDINKDHKNFLIEKLNFYKMKNDVNIKDISEDWNVIIDQKNKTNTKDSFYKLEDPRIKEIGRRIVINKEKLNKEYEKKTWENFRIKIGIPETNKELIQGKTIPLEANMDFLNAISWKKKCYLGQELTVRTQHQGIVRKRMFPIIGDKLINKEQKKIFYKNEKIGTIISLYKDKGIALLKVKETLQCNKEKNFLNNESLDKIQPIIPKWLKINNF